MEPLVSVIIPVFNTGKFLEKCLNSAIGQTYRNLELIVVDDGSTDNSLEIIQQFERTDSRIKVVRHEQNRGLFQARLTGADQAKGDFIAFLDSDDFLASDTYRRMVKAALTENADMVETNFVLVNEKGEYFVNSLNRISAKQLEGEEIQKAYFGQRGLAYHWYVIWNKLYRRDLWDECRPFYDDIDQHLVMTEDIAFSTVLYCNSRKYVSIDYDGYFYFRNSQAATQITADKNRFIKHISDLRTSFRFVENYLVLTGYKAKYPLEFQEWKDHFFRIWCQNIETQDLSTKDKNELFRVLKEVFSKEKKELPNRLDAYHYNEFTPWNGHHYNHIIDTVKASRIEYVSFDVFDTLIKRPFFAPHDLFEIISHELVKKFPNEVKFNFSDLRRRAEIEVRKTIKEKHPFFQEIKLDEIYAYLREEYCLPDHIVQFARELEIGLELRFCSSRTSAQELYELAKYLGKKIIIISDMYLPKEVIERILHQNGYTEYERLYVSSDIRLTKHHGDLYRYVLQDLKITPDCMVHIGDNWHDDHINAEKHGIKSCFFPKATAVLMGEIQGTLSNHFHNLFGGLSYGFANHRHSMDYFGLRTMLAVVANRYFDNPLRQFNCNSHFNVDPYFIGYFALGMNLLGVGLWLMDKVQRNNYETIHFVARDGYLIKKVFEKLKRYFPVQTKTNYLYAPKRVLLPLTLNESHDLFAFYHLFNVKKYSPKEILLSFLHVDRIDDSLRSHFQKKGIPLEKRFSSPEEYNYFAKAVIEFDLLNSGLKKYKEKVSQYLNRTISDRDAIFDFGSNDVIQVILANYLSKPVDAFYVYLNTDRVIRMQGAIRGQVYSFLDFTPSIKGAIRKYLYSEPGPACMDYHFLDNGEVSPVFEDNPYNAIDHFVLGRVQQGALDFVDDFSRIFHEYLSLMTFRNYEVSLPFEIFLQRPSSEDQKVFDLSTLEDVLSDECNKAMSLLDIWNYELGYCGLSIQHDAGNNGVVNPYHFLDGKSMWAKAIYFFLFDFQTFKKKVLIKFKHKVLRRPLEELV